MALVMSGIAKSFGAFRAVDDADFTAQRGQVHALLGENGAGKSSLMNVAAGLYAPDSGRIEIDGAQVRLSGARDAQAFRIGMVHQNFKLVKPFTVAENVLLFNPKGGFTAGLTAIKDEIRRHADRLGFDIDPDRRLDTLSIAEQQRVEIIKALVGGADYLILDEPSAVLTDGETIRLLGLVRELAASGVAIVLVTHKLSEVRAFADQVTVMRNGRTVASADPKALSVAELTRLVIGEDIVPPARDSKSRGGVVLSVEGLSCARDDGLITVRDVSFNVRAGEIYGVAGVGGNGQNELAETLTGIRVPVAGAVRNANSRGDEDSFRSLARTAFIPADRYGYGLCGDLPVLDNYAIRNLQSGRYGTWLRVSRASMRAGASAAFRDYRVDGVRRLSQKASVLSGGNAQKLVLARELGRDPAIVIAQSPSRGLDARACAAVHAELLAARDRGASVILISEDLDEVLRLSDRVAVMSKGQIVSEFRPPFERQDIGRAMVHHG